MIRVRNERQVADSAKIEASGSCARRGKRSSRGKEDMAGLAPGANTVNLGVLTVFDGSGQLD